MLGSLDGGNRGDHVFDDDGKAYILNNGAPIGRPQASTVAASTEDRFVEYQTTRSRRLRNRLVEDNLDGRESLRDLLELWGHRVELAANGPDGVEAALDSLPDVALIDIGLPGLDGNEVAQRIRAALDGDAMALIAMTGYGQPEDRRRALQAGFDAYLIKPVDPYELARTLQELGSPSRLRH